jgi:hypothetical protein
MVVVRGEWADGRGKCLGLFVLQRFSPACMTYVKLPDKVLGKLSLGTNPLGSGSREINTTETITLKLEICHHRVEK